MSRTALGKRLESLMGSTRWKLGFDQPRPNSAKYHVYAAAGGKERDDLLRGVFVARDAGWLA